ncbi:MAG: hypothetical protein JWR07_4081 [Nevskia sp.]|nr:hypothetical protein [Nevskia sp.]
MTRGYPRHARINGHQGLHRLPVGRVVWRSRLPGRGRPVSDSFGPVCAKCEIPIRRHWLSRVHAINNLQACGFRRPIGVERHRLQDQFQIGCRHLSHAWLGVPVFGGKDGIFNYLNGCLLSGISRLAHTGQRLPANALISPPKRRRSTLAAQSFGRSTLLSIASYSRSEGNKSLWCDRCTIEEALCLVATTLV